jgi:hypothetical protein
MEQADHRKLSAPVETDHSGESSTWLDKAQREWQVFGVGTADGLIKHGVSTYVEHPENAARDAAMVIALQAATKGPAWMRMPAYAIGAVSGLHFLSSAVPTLAEAVPRFQQTASDPTSLDTNKRWAAQNLGPLGFEVGTMAITGAALHAGGKFASALKANRSGEAALVSNANDSALSTNQPVVADLQPIPGVTSNKQFEATPGYLPLSIERSPNLLGEKQPEIAIKPDKSVESERIRAFITDKTDYEFVGKMERGTHGAYLVRTADGAPHIFKLVSKDDVTNQISRSALSAEAVNSLATRTPQYERVEFTDKFGSWYVQEHLPGRPAPVPSATLIGQLVKMNDRQAGKALNNENNWSDRVMSVLHKDSLGWQRNIAASGPEGAALVKAVRAATEKDPSFIPRSNDIVHGDFQHFNALVTGKDKLSGYIDWEGAGNGDRSIDLSRLLYDAYVSEAEIGYRADPFTLAMLRKKIEITSGSTALNNYMNYWILQVADFGVKRGPNEAKMFIGVGQRILNDLNMDKVSNAA